MEDHQIIDLFFERKEQAIFELSEKYGTVVRKIANNMLGNNQDVEECMNDVYLGVWNSLPPQKPDPLITYICRITRNISIARYHSNTAKKRNTVYDVALNELEECLTSTETPENLYEAKELKQWIEGFLDTLTESDQAMFVRRYWFSDSIGDIAEKFHRKENSVSVRLHRLRNELKKYLVERGVVL